MTHWGEYSRAVRLFGGGCSEVRPSYEQDPPVRARGLEVAAPDFMDHVEQRVPPLPHEGQRPGKCAKFAEECAKEFNGRTWRAFPTPVPRLAHSA